MVCCRIQQRLAFESPLRVRNMAEGEGVVATPFFSFLFFCWLLLLLLLLLPSFQTEFYGTSCAALTRWCAFSLSLSSPPTYFCFLM